jgi:hypothetical protein
MIGNKNIRVDKRALDIGFGVVKIEVALLDGQVENSLVVADKRKLWLCKVGREEEFVCRVYPLEFRSDKVVLRKGTRVLCLVIFERLEIEIKFAGFDAFGCV